MLALIGLFGALLAWGGNVQSAAPAQQTVTLMPRWKQGESLCFQTTYSRYKAPPGKTAKASPCALPSSLMSRRQAATDTCWR